DELIIYLKKCEFIFRQYQYEKNSFKNLSFYESYFSNFIEGTEFLIDEAEDIVFKGEEINNRHADSHDVLSNFIITNDLYEMSITPKTPEELIEILQRRHSILMKERPEKRPGEFKIEQNKAGNTYFVSPKESLGTLYQGFERYNILNPGFERALFMHFLISEIHPFDDGNGRLSRIMMNAELVSHEDYKIIIPTVHRDNYLNGLRLASRNKNFKSYVKVMDQAQAYTASINWKDYGEARDKIESDHANSTADEGIPLFNRILRTLKLSDIAS
ncbi:TPA: Fic family protein, partial [Legionella pneumophila]|nr:Fic family protein [Legionella pneumophila]